MNLNRQNSRSPPGVGFNCGRVHVRYIIVSGDSLLDAAAPLDSQRPFATVSQRNDECPSLPVSRFTHTRSKYALPRAPSDSNNCSLPCLLRLRAVLSVSLNTAPHERTCVKQVCPTQHRPASGGGLWVTLRTP